jgi:type IV pilus biogenesis protein CpaD/CtpE
MTRVSSRPLRRLLAGAGLATLALTAGCNQQPIGTFDPAEIVSQSSQAHHDLFFVPGAAGLAPGEAARVNAFLAGLQLRAEDDVVVRLGPTGSDRLDRQRIATAQHAIARGPARLRIVAPLGFARAPDRADVALVQVLRYDRVVVQCMGSGRTDEMGVQQEIPITGCTNAANLAHMADSKRDLSAPRTFEGSDATSAIAAIGRYREGRVTTAPLASTGGN